MHATERQNTKKHYSETLFLGNGLNWLELSEMGFIAHPMQNSIRIMIDVLVL